MNTSEHSPLQGNQLKNALGHQPPQRYRLHLFAYPTNTNGCLAWAPGSAGHEAGPSRSSRPRGVQGPQLHKAYRPPIRGSVKDGRPLHRIFYVKASDPVLGIMEGLDQYRSGRAESEVNIMLLYLSQSN